MLSLCATASLVESGDHASPRTKYVLGPALSAGLVENLSCFSPLASNSTTTRFAVTTASLALFGLQAQAVTLETPSCAPMSDCRCLSCMSGPEAGEVQDTLQPTATVPPSTWLLLELAQPTGTGSSTLAQEQHTIPAVTLLEPCPGRPLPVASKARTRTEVR